MFSNAEIRVKSIPPEKLELAWSDASFANEKMKSQGGYRICGTVGTRKQVPY